MMSKRILSVFLALLLALPLVLLFAVPAAAQDPRFLFDGLEGESGAAYEDELYLSVDTVYRAASVRAFAWRTPTNAVYLSLTNASDAKTVRLTYDYFDVTPKTATVERTLTPTSADRQELIFSTPHIDTVTSLTLSFPDAAGGYVTLHACYNVSVYENNFEEQATVSRCAYDEKANAVVFSGTVEYAAVVRYARETLALFAILPGEEVYLINKTPVARMGMSLSFEFSVPVVYREELSYRYVLAVIQRSGERIPLTKPYYATVGGGEAGTAVGFKGIAGVGADVTAESGAQLAYVDVLLDRMGGMQMDGILYAGDHSYYYFDAAYVSALDTRLRALSDSGAAVCLRLLISGDANGISFADYADNTDGISHKALNVGTQDGLREVIAMVDFLTARYNGGAYGRIDAIAVGRAVNDTCGTNYAALFDLEAYTERYAAAFAAVHSAAVRNLPAVRMILSLSDVRMADTVQSAYLEGDYPADLFLYSFAGALADVYVQAPSVTLAFESAALPARLTGEDTAALTADHIDEIEAMLDRCRAMYAFIAPVVWYVWCPEAALTDTTLMAAYLLQYIALHQSAAVETFAVDLAAAPADLANALLYTVQNVDTDAFDAVAAPVLRMLGVTDLADLFAGFFADTLLRRRNFSPSLETTGYAEAVVPLGSFVLWNFTASGGALGWYSGSETDEVSVLSVAGVRSLTLACATDGAYSAVVRRLDNPSYFSVAPLLHIVAGVHGAPGVPYEVRVQLLGDESVITAATAVVGDQIGDLYLNLTGLSGLASLRTIRISARALGGGAEGATLSVQSVSIESATLDSAALAERISELAETERTSEAPAAQNWVAILVTLLFVFVSVALFGLLIVKHHMDKTAKSNGNGEKKKQ